jgi:hypothetical protein
MAGSRPRSVVEEPSFAEGRDCLAPDTRRWDEFWFGIEWALCRDPAVGQQVYGLPIWVMATNPAPGMPRMRFIYTADDTVVRLLWIERA